MRQSTRQTLLPFLVAAVSCFAIPSFGLEGGALSSSPEWKDVTPHQKPDEATRKKELADREQAIQDEIARLKKRLQTTPSDAKMKELHEKLTVIKKNYGWEPQQEMMYGIRAVDPMLKGQDTMPKNLLKAFKQLNEDLKARDVDLIILPLAPTPHFAAHTLVDGIEANNDYYPGWTKMVIEMLENDLEIVDTTEEFRAEAENDILVSWGNDFHTGSTGRKIAGQALAKRLQRYDFARELKPNAGKAKEEVASRTGTLMPQRILVVNKGTMSGAEYWQKKEPGKKRYEYKKMAAERDLPGDLITFKGKKGPSILRPDAPQELVEKLKNKEFKFINLSGVADLPKKTDLALIGDSQLHSAVFGSGLPSFIMNEVGGNFRWGSKSWSGFSPPEIYREVVPDSAVQPRVVVLAFLPKYFWHAYDRKSGEIDENANKYKPKPLPPLAGSTAKADAPTGPVTATVSILKVSDKPTEDPTTLDYDEALMHVAAKVQDGPLKGQEIGVRYWILKGGEWTKANGKYKKGQKVKVKLVPWMDAIAKDKTLGQHQIFETTDQDLTTPFYWAGDM